MDLCSNRITAFGRRDALRTLSCGFGLLAFAGIAQQSAAECGDAVAAEVHRGLQCRGAASPPS
jgi:hypothetical protein